MFFKSSLTLVNIVILSVATSAHAGIIFKDSFDSRDMSATNNDGFKWDVNNGTSIVTEEDADNDGIKDPVAVYNNKPIYNPHPDEMPDKSPRNWTAKHTDPNAAAGKAPSSLRFRFAAGRNWTEQRYDMGKGYPDVWISYWMRVPVNYKRGNGANNKWFNILMGPMSLYDDLHASKIEMQDWPNPNDPRSADLRIQFRNGANGVYANSAYYRKFLTPADAGKWMHLVYHFKASSAPGAKDGVLRLYRRWENEKNYTLINDLSNLEVAVGQASIDAGFPGWSNGYIMGYANAPYANDTEWLLDDFRISTSSLLHSKAPNPPTSLIVE